MTLGLIFLIFLPIGIPVSLIIIPFIAGKNGATKLPKDWHLTYIITVGGGWSLGLVASIFILLSLALGPSLQINVAEPIIFAILIIFTWLSFTVGVRSAKNISEPLNPYEQEWEEEDEEEDKNKAASNGVTDNGGVKPKTRKNKRILAIPNDKEDKQSTDMFSKVKNFIKGPEKKEKTNIKSKETNGNKASPSKASRVSALATRRRK
jgi:hypothetical protein